MSALVPVAWRLARAGGRYRLLAQAGVNVLGGLAGALAVAVPAAALPPGSTTTSYLTLGVLLAVVLLPLGILLVAVGRLSAATRDRRLAALRVLGVGPAHARLVGAAEAALLAGAGALVGVALAPALAPLTDALVKAEPDGPGWLVAPLRVTVPGAAGVVVGLVVLAALASVVGTWRLTRAPLARRALGAARVPLPWALAPLGVGLVLTAWVALGMPGTVKTLHDGAIVGGVVRLADVERESVPSVLVIGACVLLLAVGAAYVPALLASWGAARLVRGRGTAALLAGRGVQTEPTSVARVVAGVGVVVLLGTCAAGYLGMLADDPAYAAERLAVEGGRAAVQVTGEVVDHGEETFPDDIVVTPSRVRERDLTHADLEALRALPDVLAATPLVSRTFDDMQAGAGAPFVGTCAELARILVVEGCRDGEVAPLVGHSDEPAPSGTVTLVTVVDGWRVEEVPVEVTGTPVRVDAEATDARWGGASATGWWNPVPYALVVPPAVLGGTGTTWWSATVYVEGGPAAWERVTEAARARGIVVSPVERASYDAVVLQQTWLLGAVAWFVGVAGLGIVLTAIDRQRERRRTVARLVAVGVPPRTLRAAQAWQVLVPLATAVVVGAACGLGLVGAVAWSGRLGLGVLGEGLPVLLAVVGVVVVLVPLLTLPAASTRLTPELLREE